MHVHKISRNTTVCLDQSKSDSVTVTRFSCKALQRYTPTTLTKRRVQQLTSNMLAQYRKTSAQPLSLELQSKAGKSDYAVSAHKSLQGSNTIY